MNLKKPLVAVLAALAAGFTVPSPSVAVSTLRESAPAAVPSSPGPVSWGANDYGQLGDSSTASSSVPVAVNTSGVLSGRSVTAVASGRSHACVIADGKAYCWGRNTYGQLGNNAVADAKVPVAVDPSGVLDGKTLTAVAAGETHSCAIADGRAYCWGGGGGGQLGNDSTTNSRVPVAVDNSGVLAGKTVSTITAGSKFTCAVADGRAYCWGSNLYGVLGNNSTTDSTVPVAVDTAGALGGKTVTDVAAGWSHACAIADGEAFCWGENTNGQLGDGRSARSLVPVPVDTSWVLSGKTLTEMAAGFDHTCVVSDGRAYCWGRGTSGQLGNRGTESSSVPVAVDTFGVLTGATITAIAAGGQHSCAVAGGQASCWGANGSGQLGDGSTTQSAVPVSVDTSGVLSTRAVTGISAGEFNTVALTAVEPGAPSAVAGQAADSAVTVSWVAPGSDGGAPISGYTVVASPGGASCATSGLSCTVAGLTNGQAYTFTVVATNVAGDGPTSDPSARVTPDPYQQTATVKVPKKVKYKGTTVLLEKAVTTNAGQKASIKVIAKPKAKKYSKVKITSTGKVTIKTLGKKKLKVTLKVTAPATNLYAPYSFTKEWKVKK